jgi:hypothetical protein
MSEQPVEWRWHDFMNRLAPALDKGLNADGNKKFGFFLAIFPFGDEEGRFNYISNADRKDIIVLMKEMIVKFEGQPDQSGTA